MNKPASGIADLSSRLGKDPDQRTSAGYHALCCIGVSSGITLDISNAKRYYTGND